LEHGWGQAVKVKAVDEAIILKDHEHSSRLHGGIMGKSFIVLCFLMGSSAFAANVYHLKMDLSIDGKKVASPGLVVREGAPASITEESSTGKSFVEVIAKEGSIQNHKGILMNFVVEYSGPNGERKILAKPQILAKENEPAQITVGENGQEMSLTVVAQRKSL
jgi:hypothetical protein